MKKIWLLLADRFDALKPRERLFVFLALVAVLVGLYFLLAFNPAYARYQQARNRLQLSEQALQAARTGELTLLQSTAIDPDAELQAQVRQAVEANAGLRRALLGAQARLASPEKMTAMLRDLIGAQRGLVMLSMRTAPAEDLLVRSAEAGAPPPAADAVSLYRHGIELSVQGDYQSLTAYLRKIENLPWKIQLANVSLKSGEYPQATMTISLYTLSLERTWLSF